MGSRSFAVAADSNGMTPPSELEHKEKTFDAYISYDDEDDEDKYDDDDDDDDRRRRRRRRQTTTTDDDKKISNYITAL
jgi:hypothetical protein